MYSIISAFTPLIILITGYVYGQAYFNAKSPDPEQQSLNQCREMYAHDQIDLPALESQIERILNKSS